jgi:hypothetical protein
MLNNSSTNVFHEIWNTHNNLDVVPTKFLLSRNLFNEMMTDDKTLINSYQVGIDGKIGISMLGAPIYVVDDLKEGFAWV